MSIKNSFDNQKNSNLEKLQLEKFESEKLELEKFELEKLELSISNIFLINKNFGQPIKIMHKPWSASRIKLSIDLFFLLFDRLFKESKNFIFLPKSRVVKQKIFVKYIFSYFFLEKILKSIFFFEIYCFKIFLFRKKNSGFRKHF